MRTHLQANGTRRGGGTVAARLVAALALVLVALLLVCDACPRAGEGGAQPMRPTSWDEAACPDYWRLVGQAEVGELPERGEVVCLPLDRLGRARGASALVTLEAMEKGIARERESLSSLEPSGWSDNEVVEIPLSSGRTYRGYFWNRSHLVAKSLGGPDTLENLVCATRTQNVGANDGQGGMAYAEGLARRWLTEHPAGELYYRATPVYEGTEPLCRSVFVDVRTSDGELDLRLEVYNAASGYTIDYARGTFRKEAP